MPDRKEVVFSVGSADGCILSLNGQAVLDNDEPHDDSEKSVRVLLNRGCYHMKLQYTSFRHEKKLSLQWTGAGDALRPMDGDLLVWEK